MSTDFAIKVQGLSKCYEIYSRPFDRLKQTFSRKKRYCRDFWALKDIHFDVKKGESFGIIGKNGSGKSTLLQILCNTLTPTTGDVQVNGRIAALLELGAGFNPEFTGLENIFLNGAILGFSHKEIDHRLDDILSFADIGEFIHQPVKNYSSGMFVRLAFAAQACMEPDILIVDEALSVGDIFFQQKCAKRMQQLREQNTTILFVSHDMNIVRDLCENALYINQGKLLFNGPSSIAIRKYLSEGNDDHSPLPQTTQYAALNADYLSTFKESAFWISNDDKTPQGAKLIAIKIVGNDNHPTTSAQMTSSLKFQVLYKSFTDQPIHITLALRNRYNHIIHSSGSYTHNIDVPVLKINEFSIFEIELACLIEAGAYTFCLTLGLAFNTPNLGTTLDESPWLGPITVTWDYETKRAPWFGMFGIPTEVRFLSVEESI